MIEWQDLHHSELSVSQLYALLQLRCAVFVVEQNCPYQDIDGDDLTGDNRHILGINSQPLISDAPADNAVTNGPRLRPPRI